MLKRVSNILLFILFATIVAIFVYMVWDASKPNPKYQAPHKSCDCTTGEYSAVSAEDRIADYTLLLAWFTGLLAAVSSIQIGFLIRADKTARIAADTANRSIRHAEDTSRRQLRAYLWAKPDNAHSIDSPSELYTKGIKIIIQNNGLTPAYDVRNVVVIDIRESPLNSTLHEPVFGKTGSRFVLNPTAHTELIVKLKKPPDAEIAAKILNDTCAVYVWGEIRYKDAFSSEDRITKFRLFTRERGLNWHEKGNEAT